MSRRIRSAEESARREAQKSKQALYTLAADSTAPRDPRMQGAHYRRHLADAHRTIEQLQARIAELEAAVTKVRRESTYQLSLCVSRTVAEDARNAAFNLAKYQAASIVEGPDGEPNAWSNAIDQLKPPKPKFTK
ncbi:MAG TPA: hypothetical protein VFY63_17580 [Pseudorhizobium sp.]|nr:hypothetical protein [Pseudorhizobium sp.]